jgi:hypothetical protein
MLRILIDCTRFQQDLVEAKDQVQKVATYLNERKREAENMQYVSLSYLTTATTIIQSLPQTQKNFSLLPIDCLHFLFIGS